MESAPSKSGYLELKGITEFVINLLPVISTEICESFSNKIE